MALAFDHGPLCALIVPCAAGDRFQPTPGGVAAAGRLAGLLVASPSNPAGTMLGREALGALVRAAAAEGVAFISDEIYRGSLFFPFFNLFLCAIHRLVPRPQ